jgi:hypothetical protein
MDEDFEVGNDIVEDLIPEALEYYLDLIESDDEGSMGDEDSDGDIMGDSDDSCVR